jgi:LPS export ABC transporter protein LptC
MKKKNLLKISLLILFIILVILNQLRLTKKNKVNQKQDIQEENIYSSNIIKGVNYNSKDLNGNEYLIEAKEGEIDIKDNDTIFLKEVVSLIKLKDKEKILITSDFGKYNIVNQDTIFSNNVIITYLDNKITGNYADFSLKRNSLIVSKKVVYTNLENILEADLIEMNIETKDTKISMYEIEKKVNIKSKQ